MKYRITIEFDCVLLETDKIEYVAVELIGLIKTYLSVSSYLHSLVAMLRIAKIEKVEQ